ncbi:unnamed protein product, partial [Closterium sp. Yama58-4]
KLAIPRHLLLLHLLHFLLHLLHFLLHLLHFILHLLHFLLHLLHFLLTSSTSSSPPPAPPLSVCRKILIAMAGDVQYDRNCNACEFVVRIGFPNT